MCTSCHMPHGLCKPRCECGGVAKCERDSLIYEQQRIKMRPDTDTSFTHTHTHIYIDTRCVCVCVCVGVGVGMCVCGCRADDDPKNGSEKSPRKLQLPKDSFSLKIYDVCPQGGGEKGRQEEMTACVWGGGWTGVAK